MNIIRLLVSFLFYSKIWLDIFHSWDPDIMGKLQPFREEENKVVEQSRRTMWD